MPYVVATEIDAQYLTNVNGTLFFATPNYGAGEEIWRSNGTAAGTTVVANLIPSPQYSIPQWLANVDGTLFFTGDDGSYGSQLLRSNGTAAGTTMVADINPSNKYYGSDPSWLTNANGTLFFSANDGVHGYELWCSNGTAAGTRMVADINPGIGSSYPNSFANVNGTLFFRGYEPGTGWQLWRSNGTATGTSLVADLNQGYAGSYPDWLTNVDGTLFFRAEDGAYTTDLWALDVGQDTATSLTLSPATVRYFGNAVTLNAAVTSVGASGTPTGTMIFAEGPATLGAEPLDASGHAILAISTLSPGSHTITATYEGDSHFLASTSSTQVVTISPAIGSTAVTLSSAASVYGQAFRITATVGATAGFGSGSPTSGNVVFTDTIVTNSSSSGTFQLGGKTTITLGSASVGAGGITVLNAGQATGLVLPGVMTIYFNNGTRANITPVADTIKAQYLGNADFTPGALSTGLPEIIARDPTQAIITAVTPSPAQFDQSVTLTATIKAVGGGLIAPEGSVTFTDSYTVGGITTNTTLGTVALLSVSAGVSQAQATFTTASLAQHPHTLKAIYNGDTTAPFPLPASFPFRGQWLPSTSLGYGFVVQGDKTTATLSANPPTGQKAGATITFVDSLKATAGGTVFGGVVTFKDGTRVIGVTSVDVRGRGSLVTSIAGPAGTHSITAFYTGSANFNASTSNTLLYTISVAGAGASFVVGTSIEMNPVMTVSPPAVVPNSTVVFFGETNRQYLSEVVSARGPGPSRSTSNQAQHPLTGTLVRARHGEDWEVPSDHAAVLGGKWLASERHGDPARLSSLRLISPKKVSRGSSGGRVRAGELLTVHSRVCERTRRSHAARILVGNSRILMEGAAHAHLVWPAFEERPDSHSSASPTVFRITAPNRGA